jgi:UDP-galactopyranose mutase
MKDFQNANDGPGAATTNRGGRGAARLSADTLKVVSPAARGAGAWNPARALLAPGDGFASPSGQATPQADLVCLSHLRWDFVYQRPQHLLSRFARGRRVFFVEEPVYDAGPVRLHVSGRDCGAVVAVPRLPEQLSHDPARDAVLQGLLDRFFAEQKIDDYFLWYYTPTAVSYTRHLKPAAVVYDCMDELTNFKDAPRSLRFHEAALFRSADLVFTGGHSLYEEKRRQHPHHRSIFPFPSSIDAAHFRDARNHAGVPPRDQAGIAGPRLGFFGVIDERIDLELLAGLAEARPDWNLIMIGPAVKIDPATLPRRSNIHYLGGKDYKQLPSYLAGWDAALMPFALNDSTRFISPTKTPEYLAAGKPVVSTPIRDVVRPYGEAGLVRIADTVEGFVSAVEVALAENTSERLRAVDAFLADTSWDATWSAMNELIVNVLGGRRAKTGALKQQASA